MDNPFNQDKVTRRGFIKQTCGVAGGLLLADSLSAAGPAAASATTRPPNILLIMVDQMRFPLGSSTKMPLPGYERLRRDGLTFESLYCSATPCTPSRATIFTGLHMPQHGLEINVCDAVPELNPSIPTLGHYFEHAGYRTPYFGKWHLSTEDKYGNGVGLKPYGFEEWPGPEITGDCEGMPGDGAKYDTLIAKMSVDWMTAHKADTRPWFLTCSLVNPHDVMFYKRKASPTPDQIPSVAETLPANFTDNLSGKPQAHSQYQKIWGLLWEMAADGPNAASTQDWLKAMDYYYYVTKSADDQVAWILENLEAQGLTENTMVIFLSDHGELAGSHKMMGKGPFAYEESVHVPMVVSWPGHVPKGATTKSLVQTVDILPTLLDLAGIVPANNYLPGRSFKSILLGATSAQVNDHVLMAYGMSLVQVIAENAEYGATMPDGLSPAPWKWRAIHDGTFKYARYYEDNLPDQEYEMYNLQTDAWEMENLAYKVAWRTKRTEMATRLQQAEQTEMAPIAPACFNAPFGPVLSVAAAAPGQAGLRLDTQKGVLYQVQATGDFKQWVDTGEAITGTGNVMEIPLAPSAGARFFRVKRL